MASISSLSSINGLNLWLDATDLSTFVTSFVQNDLLQWNDKSSNAYNFVPVRSDCRPVISTSGISSVAVLFNQVSSFQLLSKQKIPANSTLDFFAVLTPYSLWGPRQPIFDSADITVSETDTRFNTQIYADGNEFFRGVTAASTYPPTQSYIGLNNPPYAVQANNPNAFQGTAIYQGNLLIGQSLDIFTACNSAVAGLNRCNYLQIYNRKIRHFEVWNNPLADSHVKALAVYDNKLFATTYSTLSVFYPGTTSFAMSTTFISTSFGANFNNIIRDTYGFNQYYFNNTLAISGFPGGGPMCVYKRELFTANYSGWVNNYIQNIGTLAQCNWTPQLYKWSNERSTISLVSHIRQGFADVVNNATFYNQMQRGMLSFRGDMYMTGQLTWANIGYMFRYNSQYPNATNRPNSNYFNNFNLGSVSSYPALYYGSMILPIDGQSQRIYKYSDNLQLQNFGRTNFSPGQIYTGARETYVTGGGGMCAYKGSLWLMRAATMNGSNSYGQNYVEIYTGATGGTYSNATVRTAGPSPVQSNQNNLMIVHDGKLFMSAWSSNVIYEWGNGTSVDQSFSTLVGAPILLQIRKTPTYSQMYLNGTLVENQLTPPFSFGDQTAREMFIGGGAGTMCGGMSDPGSDHMEGAIHTIAQYNQVLSTDDRQKVEGILAWTYGIQNVLPASHPYVNSRP
jgi:hypothetical protein